MCGRNAFGVVCPGLQLTELTLEDCRKIFPPTFLSQLTDISICGAYGDPACTQELLEIIEYMRRSNPNLEIDIYTNGGARSLSWWKRLARVMGNGKVVFGIDGLEDTNHIYRQGTVFSIILQNVRAFIRAGGRAQWDFIVFKHNEHQVEQARELSIKLGFEVFQIKRTNRFFKVFYEEDPALESAGEEFGKYPVYDSHGKKSGYLELPENPNYRNDSLKALEVLMKEFGSLNRYFDETPIDCKAKRYQSVFVSATGLVFPCCWAYHQANCRTLYNVTDSFELGVENILRETGGVHQISAKEYSLKDIVEGEFFKRIEESWDLPGLARGRLKVCARACGRRMDMYEEQFENKALNPWCSTALKTLNEIDRKAKR
ncbi:MAG: radical SAM protein [Candidatus Nealsonbacteria bacterium CG02_land_8_20_14_3_00_37_10]|uniref:Radical SAM protein n=1 Tax=Candidatus Nealsonbacteria bacterium CG02_land_8_20_14_3_00_37_10 TaxID=1974699 RepID=A0A2M7D9E7_9BACT|nr:MAG: radical SAM protein [Candidatus Nealsonbacteria bacterium CG02_land_8_20_14_3_00_37_10]